MKIDLKAWLAVLGILVIGIIIGLLLNGAMNHNRMREMERMRGPGGFVAEMEHLIRPTDAQRDRLRPILEEQDRRNRAIVDGARTSMRGEMDSLVTKLTPILDTDQLSRLKAFAQRGPRRPPPGFEEGPPPPR
jgi:hypothetical protein